MKVEITARNWFIRGILNRHGSVMELVHDKGDKFLCRSLRRTRSDGGYWMGWFKKGLDAIYVPIKERHPD